jgi:hypothetical protein
MDRRQELRPKFGSFRGGSLENLFVVVGGGLNPFRGREAIARYGKSDL